MFCSVFTCIYFFHGKHVVVLTRTHRVRVAGSLIRTYLLPPRVVRHTLQRASNAIHFYLQPFFPESRSRVFSFWVCAFLGMVRWCVSFGCIFWVSSSPSSRWFPVPSLLWCSCWRHSEDMAHISQSPKVF